MQLIDKPKGKNTLQKSSDTELKTIYQTEM